MAGAVRAKVFCFCQSLGAVGRVSPDELVYVGRVCAWARFLVLVFCVVEVHYRVDYGSLSHILNLSYCLCLIGLNWCVYHLLVRSGTGKAGCLLILSVLDVAAISFGISLSGGFNSPYFPLYYFAVAVFGWVFAAPWLSLSWTTLVVVVYGVLSLVVEPGLDFEVGQVRELGYRIVALYALSLAVSIVAGFERGRRLRGLERERELHRQRTELSRRLHDTNAQWAYVVGLGLDGVMKRLDGSDEELMTRLRTLGDLSRSVTWELRHPIDGGRIFRGESLAHVLDGHAATFRAVTSVPAEFVCHGTEPTMSMVESSLLFSIVHNALTNVVRHADAGRVVVEFDCTGEELKLSVSDDGVGLPPGYQRKGHGMGNMRSDAERIGGRLEVGPGLDGRGACVACLVPVGKLTGGD